MARVSIDVSGDDDAEIRVTDNMETCTLIVAGPDLDIEVEVNRDQLDAIASAVSSLTTPIVEDW